MSKIKQRKVMKALSIAQSLMERALVIEGIIDPVQPDSLLRVTSTPAKVFRADKPRVDEGRLRRYHRQVKNRSSLVRAAFRIADNSFYGATPDIYPANDVVGVSTGYRCDTDIDNSEYEQLLEMHKKHYSPLPPENCSLQSLRASYNFKATKMGIETHKWANK